MILILTAEKIVAKNPTIRFTLLVKIASPGGGTPLKAAALEVLLTGLAAAPAALVLTLAQSSSATDVPGEQGPGARARPWGQPACCERSLLINSALQYYKIQMRISYGILR